MPHPSGLAGFLQMQLGQYQAIGHVAPADEGYSLSAWTVPPVCSLIQE